jgi:hypothetical protein
MGLPTDIVTEDDCTAGHLNHYGALYIIDNQISEAAVTIAMGGECIFTPPVCFLWRIANEIYRAYETDFSAFG